MGKSISNSAQMVFVHTILNKTLTISNIAQRAFQEKGKGALCMLLNESKTDIQEFRYYPLTDFSFYEIRPHLKAAIELSSQPKYIMLTTECKDAEPLDYLLKVSNPHVLNLFRLSL